MNKKSSSSRSRKQRLTAVGTRCTDHVTPLYPQKLALTSPTGGSRSVGIVRSRTKATVFSLCANYDLIISGTVFPHKTCHKVSWVSPDNITQNQTDRIVISKRFRRSLLDVRKKRGADIGSDHRLMIANCRFKILAARKTFETRRKKYNVQKLQKPSIREEFKLELKTDSRYYPPRMKTAT